MSQNFSLTGSSCQRKKEKDRNKERRIERKRQKKKEKIERIENREKGGGKKK